MSSEEKEPRKISRREFVKGAAAGAATVAGAGILAGCGKEAAAPTAAPPAQATAEPAPTAAVASHLPDKWDYEVDVIVIGAGATGMPAALKAREMGATVMVVEQNFDVGGRAICAGAEHTMGGGNKLQKQAGVEDSPDLYFKDMTDWTVCGLDGIPDYRYNNFELIRAVCDIQPEVFDFLEANGVLFDYDSLSDSKGGGWGVSVPRCVNYLEKFPELADDPHFAPGAGHLFIRPLEKTAREKGIQFMLNHQADKLYREEQFSGRVLGISAKYMPRIIPGTETRLESYWSDGNIDDTNERVNIRAKKGVIIATSGFNGNVPFRTSYDPRLTEEIQVSVSPWLGWDRAQNGFMILAAMDHGASLGNVLTAFEHGGWFRKRTIVGVRDVYKAWPEDSPVFPFARARGLSIGGGGWANCINVNQVGKRFYDETAEGYCYPRSNPTLVGKNTLDPYVPHDWRNLLVMKENFDGPGYAWTHAARSINEGSTYPDYAPGPVWLIFDQAQVDREEWKVDPPYTDPEYFFKADTLAELAEKVSQNPYQKVPMPAANLEATVARYNELVDKGVDEDFGKKTMEFKVDTPPFYAAWCAPVLHDSYGLLRVNADCQVIDRWGEPIPGLYAGGEAAGGWEEHGHGKCFTMGYLAAKHCASQSG